MRKATEEIEELESLGLLRTIPEPMPKSDSTLINFSSNDYLALSQHPALAEAAAHATSIYGTGSTASRLICGTQAPHKKLEEFIAHQKTTEAALFFANGYTAAVGTISALCRKGDTIIMDKLCHASLIDGARLSGATIRIFPHNNLDRLEDLLKKISSKNEKNTRTLVITEGVFSMDGDQCLLSEIVTLKNRYNALLLLDEAHSLGVLGPQGLGLAAEKELQQGIDFQMGTLGKAVGAAGGYLACKQEWANLLTNKARSFIYSTAPPPAQAAAAQAGWKLMIGNEGEIRRKNLNKILTTFTTTLERPPTQSAIIPHILGENQIAIDASFELEKAGFKVPAIRYPTVPRRTARLRFTFHAEHTVEQVTRLTDALRKLE